MLDNTVIIKCPSREIANAIAIIFEGDKGDVLNSLNTEINKMHLRVDLEVADVIIDEDDTAVEHVVELNNLADDEEELTDDEDE